MSGSDGFLFEITAMSGYSGIVGHLVSMMHYARRSTLSELAGLQVDDLDYLLDDSANSIGMLLEHVASVEEFYQRSTFGWPVDGNGARRWQLGADLGLDARQYINGNALDHYLDRLTVVRERTLAELRHRDDSWLFEVGVMGRNAANNYFKWFHVVEEELGHLAQIRLIKRICRTRKASELDGGD